MFAVSYITASCNQQEYDPSEVSEHGHFCIAHLAAETSQLPTLSLQLPARPALPAEPSCSRTCSPTFEQNVSNKHSRYIR